MKILAMFNLITFCLAWTASFSQKVWSLNECIDYAVVHNLDLLDLALQADYAEEDHKQSVRNQLPTVSSNIDYNIRFGRSIDPNNNDVVNTSFFSNNYSVNAVIDVFKGFQKKNNIASKNFTHKASIEDIEQEKILLSFRVMSAYYDVLFYKGLVAIVEDQVEISRTNCNLTEKRIEVGIRAGADRYETESILASDQLELVKTKNFLAEAYLNLKQEMNYVDELELIIEIDAEELAFLDLDYDLDSVYNTALNRVPSIRAEQFRSLAFDKNIQIAKGALMPSLALFGGLSTGYYETQINPMNGEVISFSKQIQDNTSSFVGVALTIPIFDRGFRKSEIQQMTVFKDRSLIRLELEQQRLYNLLQGLILNYNAISQESDQIKVNLDAKKIAYEIALKRYENGLFNIIELNQAKSDLAFALSDELQINLKKKLQKSTIDFYNGTNIFNFEMYANK